MKIPFFWRVSEIEILGFYPYTSYPTDVFIEYNGRKEYNDDDKYNKIWFNALRKKAEELYVDTFNPKSMFKNDYPIRQLQWDNKVVLKVQTSQGNIMYVGCADHVWRIGLGVSTNDWNVEYPVVKIIKNNDKTIL